MKWGNISLGLLLLTAAGLSWYWSQPPAEAPPATGGDEVALGFYLTDAVLYGTDSDGNLLYEVSAGRAEERPPETALWLMEVSVNYRPAAEVQWSLSARNATASSDGSALELTGDVELRGGAALNGDETLIRTSALTLEAERRVAISKQAVTVMLGTEQIEAVGMRAYLTDDRLELDSNVHAQFSP